MKFQALASSSHGNAYIVDDGATRILIECGVSFKRLQQLSGFQLADLSACFISHEHKDHAIDARARSGKPLIITTNLPYSELEKPASMQHKRIYDRILELCPVALKMTGDSRRTKNAVAKKAAAKTLLQG